MSPIQHVKEYWWTNGKYAKIRLGVILSAIIGLIVNNFIPNVNHRMVNYFALSLWVIYFLIMVLEKKSKRKQQNNTKVSK